METSEIRTGINDVKINTQELSDRVAVADIEGEIDLLTSPKLKEALSELIERGKYDLIVNLERVKFIDSIGLGVLLGRLREVREHEGMIHLICTNPCIIKIFAITGLSKFIPIFKNQEEALSHFCAFQSSPVT